MKRKRGLPLYTVPLTRHSAPQSGEKPVRFWLGFDRHHPESDPLVDQVAKDFIRDFKPTIRVAGGDWMCCDQCSTFDNESEFELKKEFEETNKALDDFKITHYLEGNHEQRLRRVAGLVKKPLRSLCNLEANLGLAKRKVQFLPWHTTRGILRLGHLKVLHGFYANEYVARKTAEVYGTCAFGHTHRFQVFQPKAAFDTRVGFAIGMMGKLEQTYTGSRPPMGWAQGFAFGYIHSNGWFDLYPVRINAGRVTIEGKVYGTFTEDTEALVR